MDIATMALVFAALVTSARIAHCQLAPMTVLAEVCASTGHANAIHCTLGLTVLSLSALSDVVRTDIVATELAFVPRVGTDTLVNFRFAPTTATIRGSVWKGSAIAVLDFQELTALSEFARVGAQIMASVSIPVALVTMVGPDLTVH